MTWKEMALLVPEFVQWVVQEYGPPPEGPIDVDDYVRYVKEFEAAE